MFIDVICPSVCALTSIDNLRMPWILICVLQVFYRIFSNKNDTHRVCGSCTGHIKEFKCITRNGWNFFLFISHYQKLNDALSTFIKLSTNKLLLVEKYIFFLSLWLFISFFSLGFQIKKYSMVHSFINKMKQLFNTVSFKIVIVIYLLLSNV